MSGRNPGKLFKAERVVHNVRVAGGCCRMARVFSDLARCTSEKGKSARGAEGALSTYPQSQGQGHKFVGVRSVQNVEGREVR